jgi:hypothetical protein
VNPTTQASSISLYYYYYYYYYYHHHHHHHHHHHRRRRHRHRHHHHHHHLITVSPLPSTSPLEPGVNPTTQFSSPRCSTFLMLCDVHSTAIFCGEYIEYCPSIVATYF